jgi:hypothetical protein
VAPVDEQSYITHHMAVQLLQALTELEQKGDGVLRDVEETCRRLEAGRAGESSHCASATFLLSSSRRRPSGAAVRADCLREAQEARALRAFASLRVVARALQDLLASCHGRALETWAEISASGTATGAKLSSPSTPGSGKKSRRARKADSPVGGDYYDAGRGVASPSSLGRGSPASSIRGAFSPSSPGLTVVPASVGESLTARTSGAKGWHLSAADRLDASTRVVGVIGAEISRKLGLIARLRGLCPLSSPGDESSVEARVSELCRERCPSSEAVKRVRAEWKLRTKGHVERESELRTLRTSLPPLRVMLEESTGGHYRPTKP